MAWERVYTVNEYWDGPRLGIADVFGVPHVCCSPFDAERQDYTDYYLAAPIDPDLMVLVLEDWEIFRRWSQSYDRGEAEAESHPALPDDLERHMKLQTLIGSRLEVDPSSSRKLYARFRGGQVLVGHAGEVEWTLEDPADQMDSNS